jgi:CRP/FNR family cyclic AMP-dependent transcriptional regulator
MAAYSKVWYLRRFGLVDPLTDGQRRTLEQISRVLEVARGRPVYLPGDVGNEVFLLQAGIVKLSTTGANHRRTTLALLYPGDLFGELAMFGSAPREEAAETLEDSVLCAINGQAFAQLVSEVPALGCQVSKLLGTRLRRFRSRVEALLLFKGAHSRIARALLEIAAECGVRDDFGVLLPIRLSQRELGNLVGLARETANVVLGDLKRQGLVEITRQNIRIKDPDRLRALV